MGEIAEEAKIGTAQADAEARGVAAEEALATVGEVMPAPAALATVQEAALLRAEASSATGGALAVPTEDDLRDLLRLSKVLIASGMFPDLATTAQGVVKMLAGRSFGLGPIESQSAFCIIQGRLSQYAKFQGALIKRSGRFDYTLIESAAERCELEFHEKDGARGAGWQSVGRASFTIEEAKAAGLGKSGSGRPGAWQSFPKAMLFARALTQGVTWFCPHLMLGSGFNAGHNEDLAAWSQDETDE